MAKKTTNKADLTTPAEHAEATEGVKPGQDVADPRVPNDVEVAARSVDMQSPSTTHEKDFVLGPGSVDNSRNPYTEANGFDHEPNKAATRQYAIDAGMWPTGEAAFKRAKRHPDGESWVLTYAVPVIPAHDAAGDAPTPRVVAADGDAEGATNYVGSTGDKATE
tara:strand:+ start:889 stop:1380 length:492 start_codon:yes stop_codon:yes gene_type:complete